MKCQREQDAASSLSRTNNVQAMEGAGSSDRNGPRSDGVENLNNTSICHHLERVDDAPTAQRGVSTSLAVAFTFIFLIFLCFWGRHPPEWKLERAWAVIRRPLTPYLYPESGRHAGVAIDRRRLREARRRGQYGGSGTAEPTGNFYVPCALRLDMPQKQEPPQHAEFFDYYRDVSEAEATRYQQLSQIVWTGPDSEAVDATDAVSQTPVTIVKMSVVDHPNGSRLGSRSLRELHVLRTMHGSEFFPRVRTVMTPALNSTTTSIFVVSERLGVGMKQAMPMVRYANPHTHKALLFQILRALHAMHSADLYHWDLRPENVLLSEDCDVILRGLGLAGSVASRHHAGQLPAEISTAPVRNQWYHPPELLMHEEEGRVVTWAHAIDIWGAACVFLELVLGRPIFGAANGVEQLIRITNELGIPPTSMDHKFSPGAQKLFHLGRTEDIFKKQRRKLRGRQLQKLDPEMQGLARRMLSLDPYRRPSVAKLLLDDVFGEFRAALAEEMVPERAPPVAKTHRMVKTNHTDGHWLEGEDQRSNATDLQRLQFQEAIAWFQSDKAATGGADDRGTSDANGAEHIMDRNGL